MDYIRRILQYLQSRHKKDTVSFAHEIQNKIFTLHTDDDGMIVMTAFTQEQFGMITDIIELTDNTLYNVITEIIKENNIATIRIDPKEL